MNAASLANMIQKNDRHNNNRNGGGGGRWEKHSRTLRLATDRPVEGSLEASWGHSGFLDDEDDYNGQEMDVDEGGGGGGSDIRSRLGRREGDAGGNGPRPWNLAMKNLHWNVSEKDLIEILGEKNIVKLEISFDEAGRSNGTCQVIFKSEFLAREAQRQFNGEILDGRELELEVLGEYNSSVGGGGRGRGGKGDGGKWTSIVGQDGAGGASRKGGILSRLGPAPKDIFSRLAPRLEDRLGKKIEDRLGKKTSSSSSKDGGKKTTAAPAPSKREVVNYAEVEENRLDGSLF